MARGYLEGPAAEQAQRRMDELARGTPDAPATEVQAAVFGCTEDDTEPHFLGLLGEVTGRAVRLGRGVGRDGPARRG